MDDQDESGRVYIRHGRDFQLLGDYLKAINYLEKRLKNAIRIGDLAAEEQPMEISALLTTHWVTIEKPLSTVKNI